MRWAGMHLDVVEAIHPQHKAAAVEATLQRDHLKGWGHAVRETAAATAATGRGGARHRTSQVWSNRSSGCAGAYGEPDHTTTAATNTIPSPTPNYPHPQPSPPLPPQLRPLAQRALSLSSLDASMAS